MNKAIWIILITFYVSILIPFSFTKTRFLSQEHGLIENLTVIFYFLAIFVCVFYFITYKRFFLLQIIILLLVFLARELDCHKVLTSGNVLKIKFYFSDTSLNTKISSLFLIIISAGYLFFTCLRYNTFVFQKQNTLLLDTLKSVIAIIIISFFLEIVKSTLRKSGVEMTLNTRSIFRYIEESLEMAIPILISASVIRFFISQGHPKKNI